MVSAAFWHSTTASSRASFRAEAASERTKAWTHSAAARANTTSITICSMSSSGALLFMPRPPLRYAGTA